MVVECNAAEAKEKYRRPSRAQAGFGMHKVLQACRGVRSKTIHCLRTGDGQEAKREILGNLSMDEASLLFNMRGLSQVSRT